jgi:thiol-disulfide isomerase/thioredoxin
MPIFVQIVSAPWCKRCVEIKPRVADLCRLAGAALEEVNYDELDDDSSLKASVTALPTIRMLVEGAGATWKAYTPRDLAIWEDHIKALAVAAQQDLDF